MTDPETPPDPNAARARPNVPRFAWLMAQLVLILTVFYLYDVEEQAFGYLSVLIVVALVRGSGIWGSTSV